MRAALVSLVSLARLCSSFLFLFIFVQNCPRTQPDASQTQSNAMERYDEKELHTQTNSTYETHQVTKRKVALSALTLPQSLFVLNFGFFAHSLSKEKKLPLLGVAIKADASKLAVVWLVRLFRVDQSARV